MRKFFYLILIVGLLGFTFYNRGRYQAFFESLKPCDKPITYRIDEVDPKFNVSKEKFTKDVAEGAAVWNAERSNLFAFDANGKISVNLIFDERQAGSNKINQLERDLEEEKGKLDQQIASYRAQVTDFKNRLATHNATVESWNRQGGAPEDEFNKLTEEQKQLQSEADKLNELATKLNLNTENYNLGVGKLNNAIGDFNEDLQEKPEEGLFIGETNRVEIYFNNNHAELVHTIAHELGHSLGIEHVNDSKAIMYPFSTRTVKLTQEDISELMEACRERGIIEAINAKINTRVSQTQ